MREIEHVQKLSLKDKLFTALGANLSKNLQATLDPPKFQYQGELEKYIDIDLNFAKQDKDIKKYLIYHWIYKHSNSLKELTLKAIHDILLEEGDNYATLA